MFPSQLMIRGGGMRSRVYPEQVFTDLAAFHDRILDEGGVPLGYLEDKMRTWIADQGA